MSDTIRGFINSINDKRVAQALSQVLDRMLPTNLDTAITAKAGGVQATATALKSTCKFHEVTTVATAADAVVLPAAKVGEIHFVKNSGANAMQVFAPTPDTIDSVATATGVSQLDGDAVLYVCVVGGNYIRLGGVQATEVFTSITTGAITGNDASLGIAGQAAAQGGAIAITGGTSSTSANAGGAVDILGGTSGATGIGGAVSLKGAAGLGGAAGGAAVVAAGAGQGTGDGGIASITGGASGAGATGAGGVAKHVGGASAATDGAGGEAQVTGGLGRGTGNGGAVTLTGGAAGSTGAGGAVNLTGGAATAGVGGAVVIAATAGTGTNKAGGLVSVTAGAATGTATGGVVTITSGASANGTAVNPGASGGITITPGAAGTATTGTAGAGGAISLTGVAGGASTGASSTAGAGSAVNITAGAGGASSGGTDTGGAGGSVIITSGAAGTGATAGLAGGIFSRGRRFLNTPTPGTATNTATLTAAQMLSGVLSSTPTSAAAYTMLDGTALKAALPATLTADDSFDLTIINLGATTCAITLTASTDITIVGDAVVGVVADIATARSTCSGTFRLRWVTGVTFVAYRIY